MIKNDGEKINEKAREQIFNPSFTTKRLGKFGLNSVRRIIEAHGWRIDLLDSDSTTFAMPFQ